MEASGGKGGRAGRGKGVDVKGIDSGSRNG